MSAYSPLWNIGDRVVVHAWTPGMPKGAGEVVDVNQQAGHVWVTLDDGGDMPQLYLAEELYREPTV